MYINSEISLLVNVVRFFSVHDILLCTIMLNVSHERMPLIFLWWRRLHSTTGNLTNCSAVTDDNERRTDRGSTLFSLGIIAAAMVVCSSAGHSLWAVKGPQPRESDCVAPGGACEHSSPRSQAYVTSMDQVALVQDLRLLHSHLTDSDRKTMVVWQFGDTVCPDHVTHCSTAWIWCNLDMPLSVTYGRENDIVAKQHNYGPCIL